MPVRDPLFRSLFVGGILLAFSLTLRGAIPPAPLPHRPPANEVIADGEDLTYEVTWTVFKLGTIRLRTHGDYSAEAQVDSYDHLPFVDLHAVHYTSMDSCFYSVGSHSFQKEDDGWQGQEYRYDTAQRRLYVEELFKKEFRSPPFKRVAVDTIQLASMSFLDGVSIAFFPRAFIHTSGTISVPTVLYGKLGETTFHFGEPASTESIDADPNPVRVVKVNGSTSAQGIYGMTGEFTGWFSDDAAGVPVKGKLKVLIGSVTVELVQWNRKGWSPPH